MTSFYRARPTLKRFSGENF